MKRQITGLVVAVLVVGACGGEGRTTGIEFGGLECVADLPASTATGHHTFVLANTSELRSLPVYAVRLTDGHTYDDFAALQPAPGAYFVLPDWAGFALRDLGPSDADDRDRRRFSFVLEPGDHAVYLWAARPAAIWLCGSLTVTASGGA